MKKLSKLHINSEKIIKDEELTLLRGGYSCSCCTCTDGVTMLGVTNSAECQSACKEYGQGGVWNC
jgi:hypothetical protein